MNQQRLSASLAVLACSLTVAACSVFQTASKGPSPDYQAPVTSLAEPHNVAAICYDDAGLAAYRVRMVQQQLNVGFLACKNSDGSRQFEKRYADFVRKFNPELKNNATELKKVTARKKVDFDVMVTEIANRTAQEPAKDSEFCSRQQRALDWALADEVTSLTSVPAPYDLGPEMKVFPCPGSVKKAGASRP
jgi:hypothetical protein